MARVRDYRLGIVLVHGMGEQKRGDTITPVGDALVRWLRRRLTGSDIDLVVRRASLLTQEESRPAELEVAFERAGESAPDSDPPRWLIRESHWAEAFRQATFFETATWLITVGPWLITSQLLGVRRRASAAGPLAGGGILSWLARGVTSAVLTLVAATATAAVMPLILLLGLLSALPIPVLQDAARAAQRNLAGSFGDLSLLVRSPTRFAAMWSQVERDVREVDAQCDAVIVIAHSQGAAVSWQAMRRLHSAPDRPHRLHLPLLVTYGQALRKLRLLYTADNQAGVLARIAVLAGSLLSTAGLVALFVLGWVTWTHIVDEVPIDARLWFGLAAVLAVVFLLQHGLGWIIGRWDDTAEMNLRREIAEVSARNSAFRWVDYWASADPAPNGPLIREPAPPEACDVGDVVHSYKVRNLGSTLIDHTVYWSNATEFIPAIVAGLSDLAPSLGDRVPSWTEVAARARLQNGLVHLLVAARVAFLAASVLVLAALYPSWAAIGEPAVTAFQRLPGPPEMGSPSDLVNRWVGAGIIAVFAALVWLMVTKLWRSALAVPAWISGEVPRFGSRAVAWTVGELIALAVLALLVGQLGGSVIAFLGVTALGLVTALTILAAGGRRLGEPQPMQVWATPPPYFQAAIGLLLAAAGTLAAFMAIRGG